MSNDIDIADTKDVIDSVCRLAAMIPVENIATLVAEIDRTETLLPVVDPTTYRMIARNIPSHLRAARAFLSFRRELESLVEP